MYSVVHERVAFDAVIGKRISKVGIQAELGTEGIEGHAKDVGFFCVQIRITIADGSRVTGIAERVQAPYSRAVDTHVVVGTQAGACAQHVGQVQGRNHVVESGLEVAFGHVVIFHVHKRVLIAYTGFCTEFFPLQLIVCVSSQNVLSLLVFAGKVLAGFHLALGVFQKIPTVTVIFTENVFHTGVYVVLLIQRIDIINLCRMFCRMGIVVIILMKQVEGDVFHFVIVGIGFIVVRRVVELVGQREVFSFLLERMLVVSIDTDVSKLTD